MTLKFIKLKNRMISLNYIVILILILKKIIGEKTNKNIRIYETENNYPRALLLSNKKVLAFSGYKKGKISEYSNDLEELRLNIPFVEYDSSVDIIEFDTNKFIMVWGKDTKIHIVICNSTNFSYNSIILYDDDIYYSTTYRINLLKVTRLSGETTNNIIIGWVNSGTLHIQLFKLDNNNLINKGYVYNQSGIDNNFISCIHVQYTDNNQVFEHNLCQYVNNNCKIYYIIFNKYFTNNLTQPKEFYQNSKCFFDKVIHISDSIGASCFLQNHEFKCVFWKYNNSLEISLIDLKVNHENKIESYNKESGIKFLDGCYNWMEQTDIIAFDEIIIATCISNEDIQNRRVKIAIINIKNSPRELNYTTIVLDSKGADFPFITKFDNSDQKYYAIFYNIGGVVSVSEDNYKKNFIRKEGKNVFEIFDALLCESKIIQVNRGKSINFSTKELIFFGVMNPLNKETDYKIFPISLTSDSDKRPYLCIKGYNYLQYINMNTNNHFCGIDYQTSINSFDYIYYSQENEIPGYTIFKFQGTYGTNNNNKGIICEVKIKVCSEGCAECDDTFSMCTKCAKGYYQKIETKNRLTFKCYKEKVEKYAFNDITNYYEKCYDTCFDCSKPKNYNLFVGVKSNQQCITCENNYYFQKTSSDIKIGNCVSKCDPLLGKNETEKSCVNCKKYGLYHIKGADEECKTLQEISKNYYKINDDPYNIVGECVEGTARKNYDDECETVCNINTNYWYIDSQKEILCTNGLYCNYGDRNILVESTKQCVLNCMDNLESYCSKCLIKDLFLYDGKCIENCPLDYEKDYKTHTCIPILKCKTTEISSKEIVKEREFDNIFKTYFYDYINQFDNLLSNDVEIVKGNNYTIELFKSDLCEYEVSLDYKISYINLTQCQEILVKKNGIKPYDILWIKVDFPKIIESTSFYYQAYNIEKEQIIDLNVCNNIDINIEMDFPESLDLKLLKEFYNYMILHIHINHF